MKKLVIFLAVIAAVGIVVGRHRIRAFFSTPPHIEQTAHPRITFIEGKDLRTLADILVEKHIATTTADIFVVTGKPAQAPTHKQDFSDEFDFLKGIPKNVSLEGYLFPDTYEVDPKKGTEGVVRMMLKNFDRKVTPEMRMQAMHQGHTLHEIITMASILEDEVRSTEDRKIVADILWRRIARGMGLQVDSSVNYATGKGNRFTNAQDRAVNSLWNTYKYRGLPAGPIGNPGLDAIQSTLAPTPNTYWYYLTAPDGTVHYAHTLEEQIANKKYLK